MKDGKQNVPISTGVSVKFLEPEFQILIWLIWRLEYRYSKLIKPYSTFMDRPSVFQLSSSRFVVVGLEPFPAITGPEVRYTVDMLVA